MKKFIVASLLVLAILVSAGAGFYIGISHNHDTSSSSSGRNSVSGVNVCWLGVIKNCCTPATCGGTTPVTYTLNIGEGFNVSISGDASRTNYTIVSVYTTTTGFTVNGIYWEGYKPTRYFLPQSVFVGTNFPFSIGIVDTSAIGYNGTVNITVFTSSTCCYFNGTSE